jgi:hypothetical protein
LSVKVKSPESLPLSRTADTTLPSVISRSTSARERPHPYWFATHEDEPASCEEAVRLWYEVRWTAGYDWDRPGYSPGTGSFTQVGWKSADRLGCGRAAGKPDGGESYRTCIVCSYGPAENVIGQFRENVGREN